MSKHTGHGVATTLDKKVAMNADYDGDETMFTLALDKKMEEMFYPFSPFFNLLLLSKPYEISKNPSMTDSIVAATSEWIDYQKRL